MITTINAPETYSVAEAAKQLGISSIKLKKVLRQNNVLLWGTEGGPAKIKVERIHKRYLDAGYFITEDRWWNDHCTEIIYVTDKGIEFLRSLM